MRRRGVAIANICGIKRRDAKIELFDSVCCLHFRMLSNRVGTCNQSHSAMTGSPHFSQPSLGRCARHAEAETGPFAPSSTLSRETTSHEPFVTMIWDDCEAIMAEARYGNAVKVRKDPRDAVAFTGLPGLRAGPRRQVHRGPNARLLPPVRLSLVKMILTVITPERQEVTGQVNFNSHTDVVVGVAVGLVNLLTEGEDRSRKYLPPEGAERAAAIGALFKSVGGRREVTLAEAADFSDVAAELRVVFEAVAADDIDSAARRVNAMLDDTGARPALERHDDEPWHLHFNSADETSMVKGWEAGCATGLAIVLGGEYHDRLGVCTAPRCDRVYVDTTRNDSRRFCSTACQNRVKAAAFRERRA